DLGADTAICPGNMIRLNAHAGFASYQWQDGSDDSAYIVTEPGRYFVTVNNACGVVLTDTILVTLHPPIAFDIGPDISLCEGDTAIINAPAGFTNYQWSAVYNISSDTGQTVKIYPGVDTLYTVKAEQIKGCFVTDSFYVKIKYVPNIHLGNDTS